MASSSASKISLLNFPKQSALEKFSKRLGIRVRRHSVNSKFNFLFSAARVDQSPQPNDLGKKNRRRIVQHANIYLASCQVAWNLPQYLQKPFRPLEVIQSVVKQHRDINIAARMSAPTRHRSKQVRDHHVRLLCEKPCHPFNINAPRVRVCRGFRFLSCSLCLHQFPIIALMRATITSMAI